MRQQGHSALTFKEQAGPETEFTKAFHAVPLPWMRIWAYHTPVTTNTSQRCTVIQHIYSTSHLGTGKNTFTPSLFTAKVAQSDPKRVKRTHKQKNNTLHAVSETSVSNTPATALYMPLCTLWNIDTNCLHRGIEILVCHRAAYCIHFFSVMANLHYKSCMWEPVWGEHKTGLFIIQCEGFCTLDCTALQRLLPKSRLKKVSTMRMRHQVCSQLNRCTD